MATNYLCSYRPLIYKKLGRQAVKSYGLPPFIDASCRREPDLENKFPSITALCRLTLFAPKLKVDDKVIYITVKGKYLGIAERHWRLVAIIKVLKRFESHREAAQWYIEQDLKVPSNCMVKDNPPYPYDKTAGPNPLKKYGDPKAKENVINSWDKNYKCKARKCGVFLVCEPQFIELHNPPMLTVESFHEIFRRVPGTRNPPRITDFEFSKLLQIVGYK